MHISQADIVHIATHALFNPLEPAKSGLIVAMEESSSTIEISDWSGVRHDGGLTTRQEETIGRLWTLRQLWKSAELSRCRLVFLAGCETSMLDWEDPLEEFVGLPGAFLQTGAEVVIGSLWEVGDLSTFLNSVSFTQNVG